MNDISAAWYRREFTVPESWSNRRIILSLEYVNSSALVFIDGVKAGEEVVTSAQFLIDSESKLHEATAKMTEPSAPPQQSEPNPLIMEQGAHPHD